MDRSGRSRRRLENFEVNALGSLETAVTLTTPEDIGKLTTEIVFAEPRIRNKIVFLAGDTVTYDEVADKLEAGLGRPYRRSEWSVPFLMEELAKDPQNMMRKYRAAFALGRASRGTRPGRSTRGSPFRSRTSMRGSMQT